MYSWPGRVRPGRRAATWTRGGPSLSGGSGSAARPPSPSGRGAGGEGRTGTAGSGAVGSDSGGGNGPVSSCRGTRRRFFGGDGLAGDAAARGRRTRDLREIVISTRSINGS